MGIKMQLPKLTDLSPRLTVIGIGGAGCNAVNNMIAAGLNGVDFVVANTDAQSLQASSAEHRLQLGVTLTEGLGAGARPEIGQKAAEEAIEDIRAQVSGAHMVFLAAGMGGGTGTGAASVIARAARELGILTVGVVTKPFDFEGTRRMRVANAGIEELRKHVDTLIVIPNQNLFRIADEKTSFAEAFVLADQVLYSGVACIVDLIIKEGLINLDFADVRAVLADMGSAMMGTGEAGGERRAALAAEEAITNPLLDNVDLADAKGLLVSITGGPDLTLFEVDEAASRVRQEVSGDANIIVGATFDDSLEDRLRVSIVASGMGAQPAAIEGAPLGWPQNPPPVQSPHVETYSYSHDGPQPPPNLSPLMSGQGYAASFDPDDAQTSPDGHGGGTVVPGKPMPPQWAEPSTLPPSRDGSAGLDDPQASGGPGEGPGHTVPSDGCWQGPGDVLIEERRPGAAVGAPHPSGSPLATSGSDLSDDGSQAGDHTGEPGFVPAATADVPRSPVRMPEVEEFPVVGQRAYYAQKQSVSEASDDANQDQIAGRKPSLFARLSALTGMGPSEDRQSSRRDKTQRRPDRVLQDDSNQAGVADKEQHHDADRGATDDPEVPRAVEGNRL